MAELLDALVRSARRTAQPYEYTLRAALVFALFAVLMLIILSAVRVTALAEHHDVLAGLPAAEAAGTTKNVTAHPHSTEAFTEYTRAVVDHLASDLVLSIVAAGLLLLVTTKTHRPDSLITLEPWNIHPALLSGLSATRTYWFRGRSGRFLRGTVLPILADNARKESTRREVFMLLPDPDRRATLEDYSDYRNSLSSTSKGEWTEGRVRTEILATILRAVELSANNTFLEVHIALGEGFALYRTDLSDRKLVMTREESKWPALMCRAGSVFYDSFLEELRIAFKMGQHLNVQGVAFGTQLEAANLRDVLKGLGLSDELSEEDCGLVLKAIRDPSLPYA